MVTIRDIKTICTAPEGINLLVVKVETSEPGLYGLGCGTFAYRHLAVKLVVEEYLRPLLIGRDVSDINDIWQLMHQNGYWRNGPIENNAISGVDMALWDIKGKMANMPLYQLFGGKCREGVPVYRHVDGRDLSEICENIAKYREIGVKTIRCQCGGYGGSEYGHTPAGAPVGAKPGVYLDGNAYIRDTVKLFDGIRSKMGDEIGLVHDVHERIAPADAVRLAKELPAFAQLAPERLYPRVLPTLDGIAACEAAHIPHKNILALQGPFSYALNRALLEQFSIRFLVTKDGGAAGGFAEKAQAAADTGAQLIVIRRPAETGETADQILTRCREVLKG